MYLPKVIIVEVRRTYIYLKNILNWAKDNPAIVDVSKIPFNSLVEQVDQIVDDLRPVFEKHQESILKKICEITGYDWSEETPVIYVYPIPFFNSFSHPLFLKVCSVKDGQVVKRSVGLNLGMLIHELIHNNMRGLPVDREENEQLINFVTNRILESISPEYFNDYNKFYKDIGAEIKPGSVPKEIESGNLPIRKYYKK